MAATEKNADHPFVENQEDQADDLLIKTKKNSSHQIKNEPNANDDNTIKFYDENLQPQIYKMKAYLPVLDSYFGIVLFGPLVVAYWRGTWELGDVYLFPDDQVLSLCSSMVGGILIYFVCMVLQKQFTQLNHNINSVLFYVISRCHAYILGLAMVHYWRGVMGLIDLMPKTYLSYGLLTGLSTLFLIVLRGSSNSVSAPLSTVPDRGPCGRKDYFEITTRFNIPPVLSFKFVMDCLYSVLIVIGLVIVQWKGIWGLIDLLLAPDDVFYSAWLSVCIGNILAITLLIIQWPLMKLVKLFKRNIVPTCIFVLLLLIEDLMSVCGTIASVFVWRGLWILQDEVLLTDNRVVSVWVSHCIGAIGLFIMFHFNSVIKAGLVTDGDTIFSEEDSFYNIKFITNIIHYSDEIVSTGDDNPIYSL